MLEVTVVQNRNGPITKRFYLDQEGQLQKEVYARISSGHARRQSVPDLERFSQLIQGLKSSQSLTYGVPDRRFSFLTLDQYADGDRISRSRKYFSWPRGAGIWMLDHDGQGLSPEDLRTVILDAMPELRQVPMLWCASASSHIFNGSTDITGLRGQRLYIPVSLAQSIPMLGKLLYQRLWLRGHGRFDQSANGRYLRRTVIDALVWQPERIDFAAGAICDLPLEQRRPPHRIFGDPRKMFDPRCAIPLRANEEARFRIMVSNPGEPIIGEYAKQSEAQLPNSEKDRLRQMLNRRTKGQIPRDDYLAERKDTGLRIRQFLNLGYSVSEIPELVGCSLRTVYRALT